MPTTDDPPPWADLPGGKEASEVQLGTWHVALLRQDAGVAREILYTQVVPSPNEEVVQDSLARSIRFHRSFVRHRFDKKWPHRFDLVYDIRAMPKPTDLPAFLSGIASFVKMCNECGDMYVELLHRVIVLVDDPDMANCFKTVFGCFEPPERPVICHCIEEDGPLSIRFR